jgi:exodeoxyribonuclease VII small subunit
LAQNTDKPPADDQPPAFEESLAKLEQAVRQLEDGRLGLSESLQCYEEGVKHLKQCHRALEAAERKIELLTGVDAEGNPITEPFDEADMSLDEKAAARTQRRTHRTSRSRENASDQGTDAKQTLF